MTDHRRARLAGRKSGPPTAREAEEREARADALFSAGTVTLGVAAVWLLAPYWEGTTFWQDHFGHARASGMLPFFLLFALPAALAKAVWPRTWESELLSRSMRRLASVVLLWWLVGTVLEAPDMATVLSVPVLAGPVVTAFGLTLRQRAGRRAWAGVFVTAAGAVLIFFLLILVDTFWLWATLTSLPLLAYVLGAPIGLRAARRQRPELAAVLDLPLGTLVPPGGIWGIATTILLVLGTALFVAPGVPVPTLVLWAPFALAVPFLVRGVLRLGGVAHSKALAGPIEARRHDERVHHLPDETLERLDATLGRFARTGRGRRATAQALTDLLSASVPAIDEDALYHRLGELPRGRRNRKERTRALHRLLGGGLLDEAAPMVQTNGGGRP
ncbi:MAG: hypothetical protein KY455_04400 [Euryarchaeota archaeon]|nr:hypothetical protein [Euryarchaeota archaeon]